MTTATTSTSSTGSSILTTLGVGSGIDTSALITKLVAAEKDPQEQVLTDRTTANTAKISSLASASSGIDNFATSLSTLISGGSLFTQATTSDSSIAAVTALAGSRIGNLSSTLEVEQLAQGQTLTAAGVADANAAIGTGSFTLTNAGISKTITLDSSNNSLTGLAAAINGANLGVSASIISDTTGARLVLKGATGATYAFTLTLADGSDPNLANFAYPPDSSGKGMTQAQAAQDARINVDGVEVTRPTNSISDVIQGVKIDLKKAAVGTKLSIGASFPSDAITQAVQNFVDAYNELKGTLNTATAAPAADGTGGGPLRSDPGIRAMQSQLATLTSTPLTSGGTIKTLAEIGVATQRDGTLTLDTTKLAAMLASNPDDIEAMFNPTQTSSSPLVQITSAMGKTKPGTYTLTNITAGPPPSGTIGDVAAIPSNDSLIAASTSSALGLVIKPLGDVASATVTVEPGLAGLLQSIRDSLRSTQGALTASQSKFDAETKAISDAQDKLDTRIAAYQAQLTTQFTKMDSNITALNATKSYLEQQIKLWTNDNS